MKIEKIVTNDQELIAFAQSWSQKLVGTEIIVLNGPLGAGKTTFVKGIAKGLGIEEMVTSPTYQIVKKYENKLVHIDAYRVNDEDLGVDELDDKTAIVCIEWAQNIADYIPQIDYIINIEYYENGRKLEIETVFSN